MSDRPELVLSLFPGVGLLDMAFEQEGFCVVRGPDVLWGGDIRRFHPPSGKFDGVIGGPPCQAFSLFKRLVLLRGNKPKFGNLIPEFERCVVEAQPLWFLMENVPQAPSAEVPGYRTHVFMLNNRQCLADDGQPATQNRPRKWTWGYQASVGLDGVQLLPEVCLFENADWQPAAIGGSSDPSPKTGIPLNSKSRKSFESIKDRQGLPKTYDLPGFTIEAKCKALGNGVPFPMGRTMAKAVREAVAKLRSCRT